MSEPQCPHSEPKEPRGGHGSACSITNSNTNIKGGIPPDVWANKNQHGDKEFVYFDICVWKNWFSSPHFITQCPAILLGFSEKKRIMFQQELGCCCRAREVSPSLHCVWLSVPWQRTVRAIVDSWYSGWFRPRQLKNMARASIKQHSSVHASGAIENIVETNNRSTFANNIAFTDWDSFCREPYVSRKSIIFKFVLLRLQNGNFAKSFASTPWTQHVGTTP